MSSNKSKKISQKEYENLFGIENGKEKSEISKKALDIALDVRKFEIELYWKRATYFWTFIGAALAGFIAIQQIKSNEATFWSVLIGCIGFVFSVAWYCANRGSKHWVENFENHVDLLEDHVIGPFYKVVISRPEHEKPFWHLMGLFLRIKKLIVGPGPFSVTKINQIVSLYVVFLWIGLVIKVLPPFHLNSSIIPEYAIPIGISIFVALIIYIMGRTDKNDFKHLIATKRETTIDESKSRDKRNSNGQLINSADTKSDAAD